MGNRPKTKIKTDALAYFHAMAGQLAGMARKENLPTLAHLFEMAEHEAAGLGDGKAAEILRGQHRLER